MWTCFSQVADIRLVSPNPPKLLALPSSPKSPYGAVQSIWFRLVCKIVRTIHPCCAHRSLWLEGMRPAYTTGRSSGTIDTDKRGGSDDDGKSEDRAMKDLGLPPIGHKMDR